MTMALCDASTGDYCNLPLYMKSETFFRKPDLHEPCPVVPPREASIRNLARAYHTQATRHLTLDSSNSKALAAPHPSAATTTLPQRTLAMPGSASAAPGPGPPPAPPPAPTAAAAAAAAPTSAPASSTEPAAAPPAEPRLPPHSKIGGSRDSLLEMSTSGVGRSQKPGAGAYSKSYTLV